MAERKNQPPFHNYTDKQFDEMLLRRDAEAEECLNGKIRMLMREHVWLNERLVERADDNSAAALGAALVIEARLDQIVADIKWNEKLLGKQEVKETTNV